MTEDDFGEIIIRRLSQQEKQEVLQDEMLRKPKEIRINKNKKKIKQVEKSPKNRENGQKKSILMHKKTILYNEVHRIAYKNTNRQNIYARYIFL